MCVSSLIHHVFDHFYYAAHYCDICLCLSTLSHNNTLLNVLSYHKECRVSHITLNSVFSTWCHHIIRNTELFPWKETQLQGYYKVINMEGIIRQQPPNVSLKR